ncbi:hypothetical protein CEXT_406231 [Caerostris extrusa]|uniref:Maturase K n=1 Tax=Caerostris extrusa TaxID=172846 RepID=A0AAV4TV90_CAEEX|nr:hypothetical protein CEXT_406231 [Caerostris extrusa]
MSKVLENSFQNRDRENSPVSPTEIFIVLFPIIEGCLSDLGKGHKLNSALCSDALFRCGSIRGWEGFVNSFVRVG